MVDLRPSLRRFLACVSLFCLVVAPLGAVAPPKVLADTSGTGVVLNEIQARGATISDEFIELYNPGPDSVALAGWKLERLTSGGTTNNIITFPDGTVILSRDYYLVVGSGYTGAVPGDVVATISLVNSNNAVILRDAASAVIDTVGYVKTGDVAPAGEPDATGAVNVGGGLLAGESLTRSALHTDTNNNAADFSVTASPTPTRRRPSDPALTLTAGDKTITAEWIAAAAATAYDLSLHTTSPDSVVTAVSDILAGSASYSQPFSAGLVNGVSYTVKLTAKNESGVSQTVTRTAVPKAPTTIFGTIGVTMVFKDQDVATNFGIGAVNASVTTTPADALNGYDLALVFERPATPAETIPLVLAADGVTWTTATPFSVVKANSPQDGTVTVTLLADGITIAQQSFTVDTKIGPITATVTSRCSPNQDSFTLSAVADVVQVFIYRDPGLSLTDLVAIAPATNGRTDEIFIGDNRFSRLYLVAKDITGNTETIAIDNDIFAPAAPNLQLKSSGGVITPHWDAVGDASEYRLRWRQVGTEPWSEVITSGRRHDIKVSNGVEYEFAVAAIDGACNQSGITTLRGMTRAIVLASVAREMPTAQKERLILAQAMAVTGEKDGGGSTLSPEEDKNGNGIPDSQENLQASPTPSDEAGAVPDRSKVIIAIAVFLILAGTGLAAYSWYQGDARGGDKNGSGGSGPAASSKATPEPSKSVAPAESKPASPPRGRRPGGRGGRRPKRKARW